ncbi:MAG: Rrf2 family transcriptional regulator [Hydrogenobacter thermophilus]|uniref:Transcriptional regulator, BadM/Rrf2 family n=1 Tax=Hydrogenobacter thermophilus (strain DSM 6534 / IAM 12695 / TK-6) TaxID=608538 RepID=D3DFS5_HYDTT|nr:Rrf2 family transcriptional regulator [Hydrogenobacter thermophilus]ADO44617.1 transcriptional regulator, BadM/Rrf2 family [Hydrogenobacter thermophilus TK-6]QWK19608.1 MAG: Rrf2 family transcriptional regulator [Hydrogenobacter thermophilus]BAI68677.1 transcriptional regulator, BadM/Rrf2 family [Hydrogenobacter thermophilus TK-6]GBC88160.1 HTH-type transcriptional regulator IscR [bacterium HR13]
MIYSETVKYALLALAYLALNRDRLVKVEEIAEAQKIPKPFLSKIFHKLARERVLRSYKGPTGGFALAVPPEQITIMDVIRYLDEDYKLDYCALRPGRCEEWQVSPCRVHEKWTRLRDTIMDYLNNTTIAELAEVEEKHRHEKPVQLEKFSK